jgi:hypothetical protein
MTFGRMSLRGVVSFVFVRCSYLLRAFCAARVMSYYSSLSIPNADCLYDFLHLQKTGCIANLRSCNSCLRMPDASCAGVPQLCSGKHDLVF